MGQAHRIEVKDKEMDSRRLQSSSGISGDWSQDPPQIPASEDTQVGFACHQCTPSCILSSPLDDL